jgi:hypothetical protein
MTTAILGLHDLVSNRLIWIIYWYCCAAPFRTGAKNIVAYIATVYFANFGSKRADAPRYWRCGEARIKPAPLWPNVLLKTLA